MRVLPADLPVDRIIRIRPEAYAASFEELAHDVERTVELLRRWCGTEGGVPLT